MRWVGGFVDARGIVGEWLEINVGGEEAQRARYIPSRRRRRSACGQAPATIAVFFSPSTELDDGSSASFACFWRLAISFLRSSALCASILKSSRSFRVSAS